MDMSVLPNNNHPQKLVLLDVGMLSLSPGVCDGVGEAGHRPWSNRLYYQNKEQLKVPPEESGVMFVDRFLEKHITPVTLKSSIRHNPLYAHTQLSPQSKPAPSWTVHDLDSHGHAVDLLQDTTTPTDLNFWLEDVFTPGFDSLLKKEEASQRRRRWCKIASLVLLCVCVVLVVVTVTVSQVRN